RNCVRSVVALALDLQKILKPGARPADPALHSADRAVADLGGFLIGEAGGTDEDHRLTLVVRQPGKGLLEIGKVHVAELLRVHGHALGEQPVAVLHLAAALAHLAVELVAQDREQPGLDIGAELETLLLGPGLHDRVLHEVVGLVVTAREREGECPQARQGGQEVALERRRLGRSAGGGRRIISEWHRTYPSVPPDRAAPAGRGTCRGWSLPGRRYRAHAASFRCRNWGLTRRRRAGIAQRSPKSFAFCLSSPMPWDHPQAT